LRPTNLNFSWRDSRVLDRFRAAVSLHSHTWYSRESLAFVPRYTAHIPLVSHAIRAQARRYQADTGRPLDFSRVFWRPPLAPREALDLETAQIEELGLNAMVSISDHDDIQAGALLAVLDPRVPISTEWTVPFGPSFFHVGVHNLPAREAAAMQAMLASVTENPEHDRIREALAAVAERPETLIVWNHPCWDEARIGAVAHAKLAGEFTAAFGEFFHALELNGLRPWTENQRVVGIANATGHILISGGDRHGLEPNANLNLTNAATFPEFVDEIRRDRASNILFMPQYREPIRVRMIETMRDLVREYPEFPEDRRRWNDRVFYRPYDAPVRPLSMYWRNGPPWPIQLFLRGLRATTSPQVRNALKFALADAWEIAS
jgi:hypothetical protein